MISRSSTPEQNERTATLLLRLLLLTSTILLGGALFGPKAVSHDFLLGAAFWSLATTTCISFGATVRFKQFEQPSGTKRLPLT